MTILFFIDKMEWLWHDFYMKKARDIYKSLGYAEWRNFNNLVLKAIQLIKSGIANGEIIPSTVDVKLGSGSIRSIVDYELDSRAIELIKKLSHNKLNNEISLRNETAILSLLKKYCKAKQLSFRFQYKLNGYRYDCCINNKVLIEFDESHHLASKRQMTIDACKDEVAENFNYTLVRFGIQQDIIEIILAIGLVITEGI